MQKLAISLSAMILVSCGQSVSSDPNEAFVDALLDKHFTRPPGSNSEGPPKKMLDLIRNCARPALLVASKEVSDDDKSKILNMIVSKEAADEQLEPTPEMLEVYRPLGSILGGCMEAAMMQSEMQPERQN